MSNHLPHTRYFATRRYPGSISYTRHTIKKWNQETFRQHMMRLSDILIKISNRYRLNRSKIHACYVAIQAIKQDIGDAHPNVGEKDAQYAMLVDECRSHEKMDCFLQDQYRQLLQEWQIVLYERTHCSPRNFRDDDDDEEDDDDTSDSLDADVL